MIVVAVGVVARVRRFVSTGNFARGVVAVSNVAGDSWHGGGSIGHCGRGAVGGAGNAPLK